MRKKQAYKICLEVIFEDEQSLNQVEVNAKTDVLGGRIARIDFNGNSFDILERYEEFIAKTDVLGGRIARIDFNGNSFDILERYEEFITPMQLAFLNSKEAYKTRMQQAINKTLSDLYEEEDWENEEEE
ncbi:hypothetical protein RZ64_01910 [[Haemophilus] ducreyi]|uniref:hypothetical protein n=1 Tax=Haemophilus ducreyi TaxID=730 RepID=UPI00065609C8|nr:hypothetical protein [[Haemophilus] ducreyi]AKO40810.1 hypothetical protein RZ64_01910 [[Haemophilus] ducreyi]